MTVYVFADEGGLPPQVLFFDGTHLVPLHYQGDPLPGFGAYPDWGNRSAGALATAALLAQNEGVPLELLGAVASALRDEFVSFLPRGTTSLPGWRVGQEVVRLTMRAMGNRGE